MKNPPPLAALLAALTLLAGCFGGPLSAGDAEAALRELIQGRSEGRIVLAELRKTDGQAREWSGVQYYELDFEGEIKIVEDCYATLGLKLGSPEKMFTTTAGRPKRALDEFSREYIGRTSVSKGQRLSISGSLLFEEKESGWNLSDTNIDVRR